ncbi:MAG: hypothetical protein EBX47_10760 [Synechococcaceae bacterium WB8_1B_057]|nr:hypothetical protein [Synechococcaceae bacterium WB6_1A_059]NDG79892.1 hypothetical protein [Synechococcaceae bacterium WB8_1B_057]
MAKKLSLKRILEAVDNRNYNFYNSLTDEEKKEFSPYILMRYVSNVSGEEFLQEWYIERTNELVNKNHWALGKNHKSLLWQLFAAIGVGSTQYHPYLALGKKQKKNKIENLLAEIYPAMKLDDIKTLASLMTTTDTETLFDNLGFDKKDRKEYE